jgi:hypothetical protein
MTTYGDEFVILFHKVSEHEGRGDHWDLMLQDQDRLLTWELMRRPEAGMTITAKRLPDHRLAYLDFEGALSENRGIVSRWEKGRLLWLSKSPTRLAARLVNDRLDWRVEVTIESDQSISVSVFESGD